jgi:uncharacterized membrane protein YebE (DUF533 family)
MFNPEQLLGQLLKSGLSGSLGGSKRRKRGGSLLGGMSTGTKAQIGMGLVGLAVAAYEHYTKQNASSSTSMPSTAPGPSQGAQNLAPMPKSSLGVSSSTTPPPAPSSRARDAMLLVQAMVAAAAADGVIDDEEKAQMLQRAADAGFDDETRKFLEAELQNPKSLAVIIASARPELATDLYAASCAAITADTDAERVYLDTLGRRLGLSEEARTEIQRQLDLA